MTLKTMTNCVAVSEWDKLVSGTYKRQYSLQQQDGCRDRGTFGLTVPSESCDDEQNDAIPEVVNGSEKCVKFAAWLSRDPNQPLVDFGVVRAAKWEIDLWWYRNFYPDIQSVANDLHANGLLESGDYTIIIDW